MIALLRASALRLFATQTVDLQTFLLLLLLRFCVHRSLSSSLYPHPPPYPAPLTPLSFPPFLSLRAKCDMGHTALFHVPLSKKPRKKEQDIEASYPQPALSWENNPNQPPCLVADFGSCAAAAPGEAVSETVLAC